MSLVIYFIHFHLDKFQDYITYFYSYFKNVIAKEFVHIVESNVFLYQQKSHRKIILFN